MLPPKASSVHQDGSPDGFTPPLHFRSEVAPEGMTRLTISAPVDRLAAIHRALVAAVGGPVGVMWIRLTDRAAGRHLDEKPARFLAMEIASDRALEALEAASTLLYHDGRGQLWIRGALGEQIVLDEMGLLYAYPDDPLFRDALEACGVPEGAAPTMADRDYVRVQFQASADGEERALIEGLGLSPWAG